MSTLKVNNIQSVTDGSVTFPQGSVSSQPVTFPSGTASNPSISFTGDTDTGLYRIDANKIGISNGGSKVGEIGVGYGGFTGNIIQVQQTIKTDNFTTISSSFVDITGFSVSITPKYVTSKILIIFDISVGGTLGNYVMLNLLRNSTNIYQPTTSKTWMASKVFYVGNGGSDNPLGNTTGVFLDSPGTTSLITYKVQGRNTSTSVAFYVNRRVSDDTALASSITAMEVQQ